MTKSNTNLRNKYLNENYGRNIKFIKDKVYNKKISLVFDESPDIIGRKTVNTLCGFYDNALNKKNILLIDCSIVKTCDHNSLINLTNNILKTYDKQWSDVLTVRTDSASYAIKYSQLIKERQN